MQQKSPKPNKSRAEDTTNISSPTTAEKKSLDDSTLVTSPTTNESAPCFNENYNISDVLARSPSGSVAGIINYRFLTTETNLKAVYIFRFVAHQ